ncbi:hypothetical protein N7541_002664 [Penicillium brevicompactum]|uniref:Chitin-binding type-4 domain-containing protein n=1 Tax=Penicillium brevicompactum TaxID=5074 RepID=A0A9W9RKA9_PENBR|nr:hypothetical protein N7541_002664 [Penicillium brevicompactum]
MKQFTPALAFASIISLVNAHGFVTSPEPRMPGDAMKAACGQQVEVNQQSDNYGNIQGELQVASSQSDYNADECDIWLCKGYKFADNKANVQSYTAGQTVDFKVDIRAPTLVSPTVIGSPLISWDVYASTATGVTANETSFSVTIPEDLGSQCGTAGDCVLQWYWYAESIDQTYESCVDFTLGGSGSSSGSSGSSSSSSAVASVATSSSVAASEPSSTSSAEVVATSAPAAVQTPSAVPVAQSTFATSVRQSATASAEPEAATSAASTASAASAALPFPTDSAEDVLTWIEALVGNLVGTGN